VCRDSGNADARAEIEARRGRQGEDAIDRYDGVLLRGPACRAARPGERYPYAIADREPVDARPDCVDQTGTVVIRDGLARGGAAVRAAP
jgi:hypothetical protein